MMIISFAHTTTALVCGAKTVTRRTWAPSHAAKFHVGDLVQAWNKTPRNKGAKKVAIIRITELYSERLCDMPESDVAAEGGRWKDKAAFVEAFEAHPDDLVWVVRFELVEVLDYEGRLRY